MSETVSCFADHDIGNPETLSIYPNMLYSLLVCCIDIVMNDLSGLSV